MSIVIVNILGILLIALIVWWFWIAKPKSQKAQTDIVDILVDNGVYLPSSIEVPVDKKTTLRFLRKDASPCAEKVSFDELNIHADLPLDKPVNVDVKPTRTGKFSFSCQMQMYKGTLIVK